MNLTIYSIFLHLALKPSSYFQITQSHSSISLQFSTFSRFFPPVIRLNNLLTDSSLYAFNSIFKSSKALKIDSDTKCKSTKNIKLNYQSIKSICINFVKCDFLNCSSSTEYGGAIEAASSNLTIEYCIFNRCKSKYGGSIYSTYSRIMTINHTSIVKSEAERFGSIYSASKSSEFSTNISLTNISFSVGTKYISAVRVETTRPNFYFVKFVSTYSPAFGAVWDWSTKPTTSIYFSCQFYNVTSDTPGAAITLYHWLQQAEITKCIFKNSKGPSPVYVYLFSSESDVFIGNCLFDLNKNESIGERYDGNNITLYNNVH